MITISRLSVLSLLLLACLYTACVPAEKTPPPSFEAKNSTTDETELISRMSVWMVAEPKTQAEIDQNKIVDYAIDQQLELERTASGLFLQIIEEGNGPSPTPNSTVVTHYRGRLLDGSQFDSSYDRNQPLRLHLNQVIAGWQEGMKRLKPGGRAILLIPSQLGYGTKGFANAIPPNSVLRFDLELLQVQ
ncbi:MAG: FKBP-type peptidyl-prolyl cis-trans isomerase [Bacteroidota bacterium]